MSNALLMALGDAGDDGVLRCSRSGCRSEAAWLLHWRNPKIHDATRRKTWLACDEHLPYLREFLLARDFPLEVIARAAETSSAAAPAAEESDAE